MHQILTNILGKPNDYKQCKKCNAINWYENIECVECENKKFIKNEKKLIKYIQADYNYYLSEGYTENDIDLIEFDV